MTKQTYKDKFSNVIRIQTEQEVSIITRLYTEHAEQTVHNSFTKNNAMLANQKPVSRQAVSSLKPIEKSGKPKAEPVVPSRSVIETSVIKRKDKTPKIQPVPRISSTTQNKKAVLVSGTKKQPHPPAAPQQSTTIKVKAHTNSIAHPKETSYGITHGPASNKTNKSEDDIEPEFDFGASLEPMPHEVIGFSDDEITKLASWALWENELPGDEHELPHFEFSTGVAIFDLLGDKKYVESPVSNYLGRVLTGDVFEIVKFNENKDNTEQPATVIIENQAVQNELVREVRLEVTLLESFGQQALVVMESLESAQTETAQTMFETILLAVHDLQKQPELISGELTRQEEEIEQLCIEFLSYIGVNYNEETVMLYLENIKKSVTAVTQKDKSVSLERLASLGTHEHKFGHKLSISNLIRIIKKQLQQQLRLGKYVVQTSVR